MKAKLFTLIFIVFLCIPAILPLFRQGFFQSDDGEWMIIRFSAFFQALSDGQFPVRFLGRLNHEYGYPVANFLYPGFMYLGIPIHVLGFGFVDTIKIIFGVSMIFSSIFCYLWLSRFFDKLSSFIGALFYLYTPYHLFDLYKRGSIGEVLAISIMPFILWQIERRSLIWSSVGIAALILSHNTLAVLFLGLIILYLGLDIYVSKDQKELFRKFLLMMMFGMGISAFFWIPAFFELRYTVFSQTQVSEWEKYFAGLDIIGLSTVAIFVAAFLLFVKSLYSSSDQAKPESREASLENSSRQARTIKIVVGSKLTIFFFVVGILSMFFSTSLSSVFWNILPVSFIQFPFRFLSITIVAISFLAGCIISTSPKKLKIPITVLVLIILTISAKPFITTSEFFDKGEGFYATNMDTTTVKNEYMPKWVKEKPVERYVEKVEIVEGVGIVNNISYNSKKITFDVLAKENMKVRVNTIYYPGWKALINSQKAEIDYTNGRGVMELKLPKGESKVELQFSETPLRLFADLLSLFSFIALIFIYKTRLVF